MKTLAMTTTTAKPELRKLDACAWEFGRFRLVLGFGGGRHYAAFEHATGKPVGPIFPTLAAAREGLAKL